MTTTDSLEDIVEGEQGDSAVISELRKQNRAKDKELEKFRAWQAEAEAAASTQRKEAVQGIVDSLNLPGLADDVSGWVEGDITEQSVLDALEARSIPLPEGRVQPKPETTVSASDVGQRVADVAGGVEQSLEEKLNAASTDSEIQQLMADAGLVRKHS